VIYNKEIVGVYHKQFLPNYGVFDENRYFQKGDRLLLLSIDNYKVGVSICEDIWYPENPVNDYAILGAEVVININASPYSQGKVKRREEMLKVRSRDNLISIAYVNMVGGQDELVFDGNSLILDAQGEILAKAESFEEELLLADMDLDEIFRLQLKDNRLKNLRYLKNL
jgi:Predicted amidohydrolase